MLSTVEKRTSYILHRSDSAANLLSPLVINPKLVSLAPAKYDRVRKLAFGVHAGATIASVALSVAMSPSP